MFFNYSPTVWLVSSGDALCNAPGMFQGLMQTCSGGEFFHSIFCSTTFWSRWRHLKIIWTTYIFKHGLKIKPSKCEFFRPEVQYLGHRITRDGLDKVKVVKSWPTLSYLKELRPFLGSCYFYRRFVPGFSKIAGPLHTLVLEAPGNHIQ